jgi:triple functional domain protein
MSLMADSQYSAQTRVQVLLEFLHEREMDLEDLAEMKRVKLEQCVQLCQFQNDANQVRVDSTCIRVAVRSSDVTNDIMVKE